MAMFFALLPGATPHFVSSKNSVSGLRDRALIPAMLYSFARVSAVVKLKSDDYYHNGARRRLRPHEKGGKEDHVRLKLAPLEQSGNRWDTEHPSILAARLSGQASKVATLPFGA
jgi:site-specific recombinase XerD